MFLLTNSNFTLNLEAVGIMLGILVSLTILLGLLVQVANKINRLESNINYLKQELLEHSSSDGHNALSDKLTRLSGDINRVEKALDLHVQDYVNRKEFVQFILGQLDEKVNHKFLRLYNSMKDMEKFLQKSNGFRVREYLRDGEEGSHD